MTKFEGTLSQFVKYFGPAARNEIQALTRKDKKGKVCEVCGGTKELQAAHIHGEERNEVIERILQEHYSTKTDGVYCVELEKFMKFFREAHLPLKDHFRYLCQECHHEYDSKREKGKSVDKRKENSFARKTANNEMNPGEAELEFVPADEKVFKRLLIQKKQAKRTIYYANGTKKEEIWKASSFSVSSNLRGNIKTSSYWKERKERGIIKVKFEIEQDETSKKFTKIVPSAETELEFVPADEKVFKRQLIQKKQAKRTIYYANGTKKEETWKASSFSASSNLRGNVKTSSFWKERVKRGITKVKFEIV